VAALASAAQDSGSYKAFFSSELGGIVIDPALFLVHLDDHMVHR
jgi:4-amino-4-deoxychorismate lyase